MNSVDEICKIAFARAEKRISALVKEREKFNRKVSNRNKLHQKRKNSGL